MTGTVYLIGFGSGDPDLLTQKAIRILEKAQIVFYDDLISKSFIDNYSYEKVYVGKRKGSHHKTQEEINLLLYEASQNYASIVRLKGGDPFIFGRGGEELLYLRNRQIDVVIIPGVTASMAAAASTKIPLTMRGTSKYLTFLPGHNIEKDHLHFPEEGTMVLYMGASKLKELSKQLIENGRDEKTPVALIQNASLKNEIVEITDVTKMPNSKLGSPLVIIIGNVVDLYRPN